MTIGDEASRNRHLHPAVDARTEEERGLDVFIRPFPSLLFCSFSFLSFPILFLFRRVLSLARLGSARRVLLLLSIRDDKGGRTRGPEWYGCREGQGKRERRRRKGKWERERERNSTSFFFSSFPPLFSLFSFLYPLFYYRRRRNLQREWWREEKEFVYSEREKRKKERKTFLIYVVLWGLGPVTPLSPSPPPGLLFPVSPFETYQHFACKTFYAAAET